MKISMQYGNAVAVVPAAAVAVMARASAVDLRVLLALCADAGMREHAAFESDTLCTNAGCTAAQAEASIAFWRGAGVVTVEDGDEPSVQLSASAGESLPALPHETEVAPAVETEEGGKVQVVSPRRPDTLPQYTTEELTALLEQRHEAAAVIDECQRIMGKIFNTHEVNVLVGLMDYLSLDGEYLVLLCAHCAKLGKKSLHYMEKVAFDMVDGGATDIVSLQETLRREDAAREAEGQIRALFGARDRKLTAAERKYIRRWTEEWKFDMLMIERAYEATVDSIGEASMRYTDGVLKRWQAEGLTTPEAVEASDEKWRQAHEGANNAAGPGGKPSKNSKPDNSGSFDTDDFFEAALRRSFEDL